MPHGGEHRSRSVPERWSSTRPDEHYRKIAQAVNSLLRGETNNHFTVTLRANETTTEVNYSTARPGVVGLLTPLSASAAASQLVVYAVVENGKVIVHHDSQPAADRTFGLVIVG